jgi:hypothetical protein
VPPDDNTVRRRWRIFLAVEGVLLLLALGMTWAVFAFRLAPWVVVLIGLLGVWLGYTLPVAFLYLIGHPPVITLAPLLPSAESRAFRRELRGRPVLSDGEFYARFCEGSGIPGDIPARLRRVFVEIDPLSERAVPNDRLWLLDDELDFADVLDRVGQEFGVRFTRADYPTVDGTLGNLVQLVHARRGPGRPLPVPDDSMLP